MDGDVMDSAARWLEAGLPVAVATIVRIFGSSSQPLGSRMVMTTDNRFVGMVSGGCVETDVYETAQAVLNGGNPLMLHYKQVENPLIEIGLNCEGKIDVTVERLDRSLYEWINAPGTRVNVTVFSPDQPAEPNIIHTTLTPDTPVSDHLPDEILKDGLALLRSEVPAPDQPRTIRYADGRVAFFDPVLPPYTLIIFGAEQAAVPLVRFARILGFRTIVSDARPAFATREKHPDADQVIAAWPETVIGQVGADNRTFIVSLNHEPRFEDALVRALAGKSVRYIGAIGKQVRRTERDERLAASGFDIAALPDIYTPIGLDIGGKSAEEIALSIIAQIVAVKNGRSGGSLYQK